MAKDILNDTNDVDEGSADGDDEDGR